MNYLKQFQYVITIAQEESISKAAEKLGIAQPTMSKYISKLEAELEIELFDRNTIPLKLTKAGECFVQAGMKIMDVDRQMNKKLLDIRKNSSNEIRLGMGVSRSMYLLPEILAEYKKTNPACRVIVEEGTTSEISGDLLSGKLDLVVSLLDNNTQQFEHVKLFDETVLLAVHNDYDKQVRIALRNGCADLAKIENVPFVALGKGQYLRNVLDSLSADEIIPAYECQNIESAIALVRGGMGAALVPSYVKNHDDAISFYELCRPQETNNMLLRRVCLFYRKEQFLSKAEQDFIECCKAVCKNGEEI